MIIRPHRHAPRKKQKITCFGRELQKLDKRRRAHKHVVAKSRHVVVDDDARARGDVARDVRNDDLEARVERDGVDEAGVRREQHTEHDTEDELLVRLAAAVLAVAEGLARLRVAGRHWSLRRHRRLL